MRRTLRSHPSWPCPQHQLIHVLRFKRRAYGFDIAVRVKLVMRDIGITSLGQIWAGIG